MMNDGVTGLFKGKKKTKEGLSKRYAGHSSHFFFFDDHLGVVPRVIKVSIASGIMISSYEVGKRIFAARDYNGQ